MKPKGQNRDRLPPRLVVAAALIAVWVMIAAPCMAGMVTSTADNGQGTLRQEIIDANIDGVPTLITFDPGLFPATIYLETRLPAIQDEGDAIYTGGLEVIIDGTAVSDAAGNRAIGIRVRAGNVTVRGLTIQNFANDGIYVGPATLDSDVIITQVTIRENRLINNLDGIRVTGSSGPNNLVGLTIADNTLINNRDDGISVEGSLSDSPGQNEVYVLIDGNRIVGSLGVVTGGTITGDGIRVLGGRGNGSGNQVFADIINNRVLENIDDGIVVAGAGGNAASDNTIVTAILDNIVRDNGAETSINGNGIVVRGGSRSGAVPAGNNNTIEFEVNGNRSMGNKDTGIVVSGGLGSENNLEGVVTSNRARDNGWDGLRITGGIGYTNQLTNIWVERNLVVANLRDGINVNGGSGSYSFLGNVALVGNRAFLNDRFGILVTAGSGMDNFVTVDSITGNRTMANARDGMFIDESIPGDGDTPIDFNRSHFNGEDGIDIDSVGYILTRNRAIANTADGIAAPGNSDGGGNLAFGNASCNTPGCF